MNLLSENGGLYHPIPASMTAGRGTALAPAHAGGSDNPVSSVNHCYQKKYAARLAHAHRFKKMCGRSCSSLVMPGVWGSRLMGGGAFPEVESAAAV